MARQKAWTKTDADTRKGVSNVTEFAQDTKRSPQPPNTTLGTPNGAAQTAQKSPVTPLQHTPVNKAG
jgi:hypothetical protein